MVGLDPTTQTGWPPRRAAMERTEDHPMREVEDEFSFRNSRLKFEELREQGMADVESREQCL